MEGCAGREGYGESLVGTEFKQRQTNKATDDRVVQIRPGITDPPKMDKEVCSVEDSERESSQGGQWWKRFIPLSIDILLFADSRIFPIPPYPVATDPKSAMSGSTKSIRV
jgi:hypothetical protein